MVKYSGIKQCHSFDKSENKNNILHRGQQIDFIDNNLSSVNRGIISKVIQGYFGRPDSTIKCKASIDYRINIRGKNTHKRTVRGEGGSDANTAGDVNMLFNENGLNTLANIRQAPNGNPPGQCAEPHAIADALEKMPNHSSIENISVNTSTINEPTQAMLSKRKKRGDEMPRCATCQQWVPNKKVPKIFLQYYKEDIMMHLENNLSFKILLIKIIALKKAISF